MIPAEELWLGLHRLWTVSYSVTGRAGRLRLRPRRRAHGTGWKLSPSTIYRAYSEVVRAVDAVSLTVDEGEFVAIYGPSGSGKTTLLMPAAAIMAPD